MRATIIGIVSATLLAGCMTPAQQAQYMEREMDRRMQVYGPACVKLGYPANSDAWRQCILQLSTREEQDRYYRTAHPPGYWYW